MSEQGQDDLPGPGLSIIPYDNNRDIVLLVQTVPDPYPEELTL